MNKNKKIILWIAIVAPAVLVISCQQQAKMLADAKLRRKANQFAQKCIIVDTHQDVPYRLLKKMEDISKRTEGGEFDYPRARKGGLNVVFMAAYVPAEYEKEGGAKTFADKLIDMIEGFVETWPDKFVMARSVADVKEQFGDSKISLAMGIENGSAIEGNLDNLKYFVTVHNNSG